MPLSSLQSRILLALSAHRNPESYVAGGAVLNRDGPRISADIDIFHDRETAVSSAADLDAKTLLGEGFGIGWLHREPGLHAAVVERDGESTRLEWARDSDFRFFSTMRDSIFGYRLHLFDLATNKALAAAGRREPRDILDLIHIHDHYLPIGTILWAAVAKDPGFTPESLISEILRNARYRSDEYADLVTSEPVDAGAVSRRLKFILGDAEDFISSMPAGREGFAYLDGGRVVQPDPAKLASYTIVEGCRRGHWPSSPDIAGAMIDDVAPR